MKHELKRDEIFVSEIFDQLSEESNYHYQEALDYLDGSIYLTNMYESSKKEENFDGFFEDYLMVSIPFQELLLIVWPKSARQQESE